MSMTILFMGLGNVLKNRVAVLAIALVFLVPVSGFCQDQDEEASDEQATSSNVWEGTGSNSTTTIGSTGAARPGSSLPPSATSGVGSRGPQITSDDPGGNPDVPFDDNMNILFVLSGIAFSWVVLKKQFKVKLLTAK